MEEDKRAKGSCWVGKSEKVLRAREFKFLDESSVIMTKLWDTE